MLDVVKDFQIRCRRKKYVDNLLFCLDCKGELENPLTWRMPTSALALINSVERFIIQIVLFFDQQCLRIEEKYSSFDTTIFIRVTRTIGRKHQPTMDLGLVVAVLDSHLVGVYDRFYVENSRGRPFSTSTISSGPHHQVSTCCLSIRSDESNIFSSKRLKLFGTAQCRSTH